jgi:Ras-related protein Rab-33B
MENNENINPANDAAPSIDKVEIQKLIPSKPARLFKVIVIGDSNVGKTCLTFRFCGGKFLEKSEATIGVDFREKALDIEDEKIKLQIWDTGIIFFCFFFLL